MSTNEETTPAPRRPMKPLSLKLIDDKVNQHDDANQARFGELDERLGNHDELVPLIKRQLTEARENVEKLRQDKHVTGQVISDAIGRITKNESELTRLSERLDKVTGDDSTDPAIQRANQQEFERLNGRLEELFGRASQDVLDLRADVDSLISRADETDVRVGMLEEGQQSTNQRVDHFDRRVSVLERISNHVPLWPLAVGALIGIVVGILWGTYFNYTQQMQLADGTVVPLTYEAARTVGAWFVGILVGLAVAGILTIVASRRKEKKQEHVETTTTRTTTVTPHRRDEHGTAPTKVLETQGTASGAH